MDELLENYLEKVDRYLRTMPVWEKTDIVQEIKSEMMELKRQGIPPEKIIERLGDPKKLAKAYLGGSISENDRFSWKKLRAVIAFYSMAGIGGVFVLPFVGMLSVGLLLSGILAPIAGMVKFVGFLFGFRMPFIMFQFGSYTAAPPLACLLSIIFGVVFLFAGKGLWKLMLGYIRMVSQRKKELQIEL